MCDELELPGRALCQSAPGYTRYILNKTDLVTVVPVPKEFGFDATFYVTSGFLGTPGYLSAPQLQELSCLGFEMGCHSMTHAYLSDLGESALQGRRCRPKNNWNKF